MAWIDQRTETQGPAPKSERKGPLPVNGSGGREGDTEDVDSVLLSVDKVETEEWSYTGILSPTQKKLQ